MVVRSPLICGDHARQHQTRTAPRTTTGNICAREPVATQILPALAAVLISALATGGCSTALVAGDTDSATIEGTRSEVVRVRAEGGSEAVPDIAVLGMSVRVTESSVSAARDRAARLTQAVLDELTRHGVEEEDIRTSRFSIDPDYQYTNDGGRRLNGYRVVHGLTVTYRDLDAVGAVIDAASRAGGDALAIDHIAFTHADPERHRQAARRDAVDRLHRTAQQLAEASNRELGPLLEISEGVSPDYGPYQSLSADAAMLKSEAADTPVSVGSDVIRVTVHGVFALR